MNGARMERASRRGKTGSLSGLSGGGGGGVGAGVRRQRSLEWSGDRYSSSDDERPSQPPLADRVFASLLAQATQQFDDEQRRIYGSEGEKPRYVPSPQRQASPFPHDSTARRYFRNRNSKGEEIFNGDAGSGAGAGGGGTLSRRTRRSDDFTLDNNARNARLCLNNGTSNTGGQASERECYSPPEPAPPEVPPRGPSLHVTLRHRPAPCDPPGEPDRLYLSEEFVMSEGGHGSYPARSPISSSTTGHSSSSHHSGKPSDANEFLLPFVTETMEIIQTPLEINDHLLEVHIRAIICDSPARAYIKGIANFNSQNGCPKCTTIGEYSYVSHCNVFPRHDCPQRTNEEFRDKKYGSHHKMDSALIQLPIDMILDFPVADSLHLIDLGVMKRCLMGWRDGSFTGYLTKWRAAEIASISHFLLQCKLPQEIHRSVRGLDTLAFWKATEFRSFIYYLGIVVLKKYLQPDAYDHFLLLFCAVTICSTEAYNHLLPIAQSLFSTYIEYYRDIYGEAHMTSNVHNLCHVVEEVKRFGVLTSFNAYPFENTLYQIKRLLRTGYKPLQQAAKRIMEKNYIDIYARQTKKLPAYPRPKKIIMVDNFDYDLLDAQTDKSQITFNSGIEFQDYSLSNDGINCWFLTNDNCIATLPFMPISLFYALTYH